MPDAPVQLYHFSEDHSIAVFRPHVAATSTVAEARVWAIDPAMAHLYYFPRNCPRVTFYASDATSREDRERFFGHTTARYVAAIETGWLDRMRATTLHRYVFPTTGFLLEDAGAGHWVCRDTVHPLRVEPVGDLIAAHAQAGVEFRIMPSLWPLYEAVIASSLQFSIIRWRYASPRPQGLAPPAAAGKGANV